MKDCPVQKCLLSVLAVFAFMMAYEIFEHSVLLDPLYKATQNIWRPRAQMDDLTTWYMVHTAILAALFVCLYSRFSDKHCGTGAMMCSTKDAPATVPQDDKPCPYKRSVVFGIKIGLIMGVLNSRSYAWMPIPMELSMGWFFGSLAEGAGIGLVLGLVSKCGSKGECSTK